MRIYYKETNGNNLLFVTDGITVKAFYDDLTSDCELIIDTEV